MLIRLKHNPPRKICLLRLSALGDVCHTLALVRRLQDYWPQTGFTWLIGQNEHRLLKLADGVEFITVNKKSGLHGAWKLARDLTGREFDVSLHLQLALRASLYGTLIRAPMKLGFDRQRAREGQWLFTTHRIEPAPRCHVLDGLLGFADALGAPVTPLRWDLAPAPGDIQYAQNLISGDTKTLLISACSSHAARNWSAAHYAAVADYAVLRHNLRVILVGGPSAIERQMATQICSQARVDVIDQVGLDTLPQLLALMSRASVLLSPDSGPAHMATMVGLPVVGLYAATNPARSGPYRSLNYCVNRYPEAAAHFLGRKPEDLPWTTKIERPGVMDLITVGDVTERLDAVLEAGEIAKAGKK